MQSHFERKCPIRVNIYAEELTDRVEIVSKVIDGREYTAVRLYLELPVTVPAKMGTVDGCMGVVEGVIPAHNVRGPFLHRPGDDDSSAVTFWGKQDLREILRKALRLLDEHYASKEIAGYAEEDDRMKGVQS